MGAPGESLWRVWTTRDVNFVFPAPAIPCKSNKPISPPTHRTHQDSGLFRGLTYPMQPKNRTRARLPPFLKLFPLKQPLPTTLKDILQGFPVVVLVRNGRHPLHHFETFSSCGKPVSHP